MYIEGAMAYDKEKNKAHCKEYYANNREKLLEYHRRYREENKERLLLQKKEYCKENKEKITAYKKEYYAINRERLVEEKREYRKNNPEKIVASCKKYYNLHKEERKKKDRQYYERNIDIITKRNKAYCKGIARVRKYGMTTSDYNSLFNLQNGVCAICGKKETAMARGSVEIRQLSIDHDHTTGEIRGLLCHRCNAMLGYSKDDVFVLENAINYLTRFERGDI